MKKLLAMLLAIAMALSLAACGGKNDPTDPTDAPGTQPTEPDPNLPSFTFTQFGDARIRIVGSEFVKDDEEDILRIYYEYTNTGDTARGHYPSTCLNFLSVTQDGNECLGYSFTPWNDSYIPEDSNAYLHVQPGRTMRNTVCFRCDPNGGPVKVSCYVMIGSWVYEPDSIVPFEFEVDPANLMGAPAPFVLPPIADPTYTAGMSASGVYGYAENQISINGVELTKDDEGVDVLRVKLTVTNNGDESMTPVMLCDLELYQDGIGLPYPSLWDMEDPTAEDEAYEEDLEPGQTVNCNALFYLRNKNPVEAVVESTNSDVSLGARFDVQALFDAAAAEEQANADAQAAARQALVGTWLQRDSDWDDTFIFYADGTGNLISGPEYPFTYSVSGDTLTLTYGPDDTEEFTFTVNGSLLTLIDMWGDQLLLDKQAGETQQPTQPAQPTEPTVSQTEPAVDFAKAIVGTWVSPSDGETYSFNADGTGYQIYQGYRYDYTYRVADDYMWITYSDGTGDEFYFDIEGNTFCIAGQWTYTLQ